MKSEKVIIISLICIILVITILGLLAGEIFGTKMDKNKIISKFKQNEDKFNACIEEMNEEYISFERKDTENWKQGEIIIEVREELNDGTARWVNIEKEEYTKYQEIIDLMEKLNIKFIYKAKGNIQFHINAALWISQEIVKLIDENEFLSSGYIITYKEDFGNDWYYIEQKSR